MKAQVIPLRDYYRDWHPLADQIFDLKLMSRFKYMSIYKYVESDAKSPFVAKDWQILMLPFQLCSYALGAFEDPAEILKEFEEDGMFSIADSLIWKALIETIWEIGDQQFISSTFPMGDALPADRKRVNDDSPPNAVLYDLTNMATLEPRNAGGQYSFAPYAFGKSMRWGALCEHDNVTMVGGDAAFVAQFLERCGGIERVQKRYLYLVEEDMIYSDDQEFYVQLSEKIGWPVPHFEETNYV